MAGGIPIRGLADLLAYRQLQRQSPLSQIFQGVGEGVASSITAAREEQKMKKAQEAEYQKFLKLAGGKDSTNANIVQDITYSADKGTQIKYSIPTEEEKLEKQKLELEVERLSEEMNIIRGTGSPEVSTGEVIPIQKPRPIRGSVDRADSVIPSATIQGRKIVNIPATQEVARAEAEVKGEEKGIVTWADEAAQRKIKANVVNPKLNYYMDIGGRAYAELKDEASKRGIELDFSKGGINYYKNLLVKKGLQVGKYVPLMTALDKLRPELGTELMRQLGAFRSATMAKRFENTLAQFNGNIKEDIANMVTTISKNAANVELIDSEGNVLPDEARDKRMREAEASLIREYNYAYRNMGIIDKPYLAGRSYEWIAENARFNAEAEKRISDAMAANPGYSRTAVAAKLIEQGLL